MNIQKRYNSTTEEYEFDLFQIVHSMVGGQITLKDDEFTYHDDQTPPTESEIDAERVRLEAEYDAQEYARNRQSEYPTIEELTVALYDTDDKAALETKRAAVKAKWPKDNSGPVE